MQYIQCLYYMQFRIEKWLCISKNLGRKAINLELVSDNTPHNIRRDDYFLARCPWLVLLLSRILHYVSYIYLLSQLSSLFLFSATYNLNFDQGWRMETRATQSLLRLLPRTFDPYHRNFSLFFTQRLQNVYWLLNKMIKMFHPARLLELPTFWSPPCPFIKAARYA